MTIKDVTPVHLAAANKQLSVCQYYILDRIEDKSPKNNNGSTTLHVAAKCRHLEIFSFMMNIVDDKNPRNNMGLTQIHIAAFGGHLEICENIMEYLTDLNQSTNDGRTPLNFVASLTRVERNND